MNEFKCYIVSYVKEGISISIFKNVVSSNKKYCIKKEHLSLYL